MRGISAFRTPVFKTAKRERYELNQKLIENGPQLLMATRRLMARSLAKKMGKNVRMVQQKLMIDGYMVEKQQECLMRIVEVYWDTFREVYGSEFMIDVEGDDESLPGSLGASRGEDFAELIDEIKKVRNLNKKPKKADKNVVIRHMRQQFSSRIPPSDKKCVNIANAVIKNISALKKSAINAIELFVAMDLSGDAVMEALTEIRREVSGTFDEFLETSFDDFVGDKKGMNYMERVNDWAIENDLNASELATIVGSQMATDSLVGATDEMLRERLIEQIARNANVVAEVTQQTSENLQLNEKAYAGYDVKVAERLEQKKAERDLQAEAIAKTSYPELDEDAGKVRALDSLKPDDVLKREAEEEINKEIQDGPTYRDNDVYNNALAVLRRNFENIKIEKGLTRATTDPRWQELKKLRANIKALKEKVKRAKDSLVDYNSVYADIDNRTTRRIKKLNERMEDIGDKPDELARLDEAKRLEYQRREDAIFKLRRGHEKTLGDISVLENEIAEKEHMLNEEQTDLFTANYESVELDDRLKWLRRNIDEELLKVRATKQARQNAGQDVSKLDKALNKYEDFRNEVDSLMAQPGESVRESIREGGAMADARSGVKNVLSRDKEVLVSTGDPSVEGKTSDELIKEFTALPSAPPTVGVPTFDPSVTIQKLTEPSPPSFKGKTSKEIKEDKKNDIQNIKDELDRMVKTREIEKATNQDMLNIIGAIMFKLGIEQDHLTSKDVAKIVQDFYKKYPNNTTEPKPLILKLPTNNMDMFKISTMYDWMVTHSDVPFMEGGKPVTPKRAMELMAEALQLTKPEGKVRSYPKSKWLYDRDLTKATLTAKNQGITENISIAGRFGITSLNSKFEDQYLNYLKNTINNIVRRHGTLTADRKKEILKEISQIGYSWGFVNVIDPLKAIGLSEKERNNADAGFKNQATQAFKGVQQFVMDDFNRSGRKIAKMTYPIAGAYSSANRLGVAIKTQDLKRLDPEMASMFDKDNEAFIRSVLNGEKGEEAKTNLIMAFLIGASDAKGDPGNYQLVDLAELGIRKGEGCIGGKKTRAKKSVSVYASHADMLDRLGNLIDSVDVGNTSVDLKNEIMGIIDLLLKAKKLSKKEHSVIYNEYVKN